MDDQKFSFKVTGCINKKGNVSIDELVNILIDKMADGIPKDAEIIIEGRDNFYFDYDSVRNQVFICSDDCQALYSPSSYKELER